MVDGKTPQRQNIFSGLRTRAFLFFFVFIFFFRGSIAHLPQFRRAPEVGRAFVVFVPYIHTPTRPHVGEEGVGAMREHAGSIYSGILRRLFTTHEVQGLLISTGGAFISLRPSFFFPGLTPY